MRPIVATYTPDKWDEKGEMKLPDKEKAREVTIVSISEVAAGKSATFIDKDGSLRSAYLEKFSNCRLREGLQWDGQTLLPIPPC